MEIRQKAIRARLSEVLPHAIVHAAGHNALSWIGTTPAEDFMDHFTVNVWSFYEIINQAVAMGMAPMPVVAIGSEAAWVPMRCSSYYCASKAALVHMVKVMARELAPKGWRINCVSPGVVSNTLMTAHVFDQVTKLRGWSREHLMKVMMEQTPDGRMATPEDVAHSVLFLLGPNSGHLNGVNLEVTGGK